MYVKCSNCEKEITLDKTTNFQINLHYPKFGFNNLEIGRKICSLSTGYLCPKCAKEVLPKKDLRKRLIDKKYEDERKHMKIEFTKELIDNIFKLNLEL